MSIEDELKALGPGFLASLDAALEGLPKNAPVPYGTVIDLTTKCGCGDEKPIDAKRCPACAVVFENANREVLKNA